MDSLMNVMTTTGLVAGALGVALLVVGFLVVVLFDNDAQARA